MKPILKWRSPDKGAMAVKTLCGRYSVCKVSCYEVMTYELWQLLPARQQLYVGRASFAECCALAEAHVAHTERVAA